MSSTLKSQSALDGAHPDGRAPVATGTALSALDPAFRDRPHEALDDLRQREPVHQDRTFDRVVLTRASDVRAVLNDRQMASDPRKSRPGSFSRLLIGAEAEFRPTMLHLDDPDHRRLRGLVAKAFNQRSADAMRPSIAATAEALVEAAARHDAFDVIAALARPLPIAVMARILGVDPADQEQFAAWSDDQILIFNPARSAEQSARLHRAQTELHNYLAQAVSRRRRERGDDLISSLIAAEEDGDRLDEAEIVGVCRLLLVAGNVTTRDLIGNGVAALLAHPGELAKLREDPCRIGRVVDEILRFDPPVVQAARQAAAEREIGGCPVAQGQSVVAMLLAANRDPELYWDPHAFMVDRPDSRHFSFGGGAHFCLGAPLALAEGQIAISALMRRFPQLRLADGRPLIRKSAPSLNGFEAVWVRQ